jgi:hypothetical protein
LIKGLILFKSEEVAGFACLKFVTHSYSMIVCSRAIS